MPSCLATTAAAIMRRRPLTLSYRKVKRNEAGHPGDMSVRDGRGVGMARQTKNTGSSSAPPKESKLQGSHQAVKYRWHLRWLLNKYNDISGTFGGF